LSTTRRVRLSVWVIEVFEELYAHDLESQATELAYHAGEAEAMIGSEKLVRYSAMAGEYAPATHAYEEAIMHFQRALMARERQPIDEQIAALLHGLGRAQMATASGVSGRQMALDNLRRALDYYIETADILQAMDVATPSFDMGGLEGITEFINRALEVVPADSHDAGRLLSRLGMAKFQELGDDEGAQDAFIKALVIARREEDMALEAWTSARASFVDAANLRYERRLERGLRAIELARRASEPHAERQARGP